jgi:uncharacterized protein (DUF342 family)
MTDQSDEASPRIKVNDEGDSASLEIPAAFPREHLTKGLLTTLLKEQEVEYTAELDQRLQQIIDKPPPAAESVSVKLAEATEPTHGEDGWVEWLVQEPEEQSTDLSFYERSAFVMVEANQTVGRIHDATDGEDGRDVTGKVRAAKPGRAAPWSFDESLTLTADGSIVAQMDGMLIRSNGKAHVSQVLEVKDNVDFSTGNIDFDGHVSVAKNVCDRFKIKATGSVEVRGLIEAATVHCDGDLMAHNGIASREAGQLTVGGQLNARYLNAVKGQIAGPLRVQREVFNSELEVDGVVEVTQGAIIGGTLTAGGKVEVGTLGSDGGARTCLILGITPRLDRKLQQLDQMMSQYQQRLDRLQEEQQSLNERSRLGAQERERQTELMFEISQAEQTLGQAQPIRDQLAKTIKCSCLVDLSVAKILHAGVRLNIGNRWFLVNDDLRGPLTITVDERGEPQYQPESGQQSPLQMVASTRNAAA